MRSEAKHGKMLTVKNGYLRCPTAGCRNGKVIQVPRDAIAWRIVAYCRECKQEHIVDMEEGQCFERAGANDSAEVARLLVSALFVFPVTMEVIAHGG